MPGWCVPDHVHTYGDVVRDGSDLVADFPGVYQCQGGMYLIMYTRTVM